MLSVRRYNCSATKSGCPRAPVIKSVPAKLASKTLQLVLSRSVDMTAIIVKMFKNTVNGGTSRFMTVIDISIVVILLVRKDGCHSGKELY